MAAKFRVVLFLLMTHAAAAMAQTAPEPIRYTLNFPAPQTHYVEVTATVPTGRVLDVDKSKKNHWRVTTGGAPTITLRYRVYCREMSVRTNWVESDFAL